MQIYRQQSKNAGVLSSAYLHTLLNVPVREGMYVRVVGHLKTFRDEKSLNAFKVEPLTNTNQITQHLLDIVHMHLFNTRGPIGGNAPSEFSHHVLLLYKLKEKQHRYRKYKRCRY